MAHDVRPYSRGVIGGTFDVLHVGHKKLISTGLAKVGTLYIGVTSDHLANLSKDHEITPFEKRVDRLVRFVRELGAPERVKIVKIEDPFGPTVEDPSLEVILVTEAVLNNTFRMNEIRGERGMKKLDIMVLPFVKAEDGGIVSSTRIRQGVIDGQRIDPSHAK